MPRSKTLRLVDKPFTVDHFRAWVEENELRLEDQDEGDVWPLEDFQLEIVRDIFALPVTGACWIVIPEGNAKTTLMAGVGLYHLEHTRSPWVPVGAAAREQAEIMYSQAAGFIERCPKIRWNPSKGVFHDDSYPVNEKGLRAFDGYRRIDTYRNGGRGMKVYAADEKTGDGVIPTLALIDELHRHDNLRLYRLWRGKLRKRGGRIVVISTAGEPGTEFEEQRDKIRNEAPVRRRDGMHLRAEGKGGRLIFHEWKVTPDDAYTDFEKAKQANPLSTITAETLAEDFGSEDTSVNDFRRLKCNIATRSEEEYAFTDAEWDAMLDPDAWDEHAPCCVGADFAWKWDTTALVPFQIRAVDDRVFGDARVLTPPRDGSSMHPDVVKQAFLDIGAMNKIEAVVMDVTDAEDIAAWLQDEMDIEVFEWGVSNQYAVQDYDRMMNAVRNGWVKHTGSMGLRSHALNAISRRLPGGDRRFDRPSTSRNAGKQDRRVIDALTAAGMVNSVIGEDFGFGGEVMAFTADEINGSED